MRFNQAAVILRRADRITVLTGAGVSAESGIPTFRDALTGLWAKYDPEELATEQAFRRNPQLVWDWYASRREKVEAAVPNGGHHALVSLQKSKPGTTLITQNVDGLHSRAGSEGVVELHGNIHRVKCVDRCSSRTFLAREISGQRCPACGAWLRPDVVWFGEALAPAALTQSFDAARRCGAFLCAGTSALVDPAASLPLVALSSGAKLIEVNPNHTRLTESADCHIAETAAIALPRVVALI